MKKETIVSDIKQTKHYYNEINIPTDLSDKINEALEKGNELTSATSKQKTYKFHPAKYIGIAAALVLSVFIVGLNSSKAFAMTMKNVPVLGNISKILTFRNYEETDANKTITVVEPHLQDTEDTQNESITNINAEIDKIVEAYRKNATEHIQDYKDAFLATGGTEEEFTQKDIKVDVNYEVKYESNGILSFVLTANENWCGAYGVQYFYNLDTQNFSPVSLQDILGSDWINIANQQIKEQMESRMKEDSYLTYWDDFSGINENTSFYINENGNPVVVFAKYEIAPGAYGIQEFEIKK